MGAERVLVQGLVEAAESGAGKRLLESVVAEISSALGAERSTAAGTAQGVRSLGTKEASTFVSEPGGPQRTGSSLMGGSVDALPRTGRVETRTAVPLITRLDNRSLAAAGLLREQIEHTPDGYLKPGVYRFNWQDFVHVNGFNDHRIDQLRRAQPLLRELNDKGLDEVFAGGSFVTKKVHPGDIDFTAILKDDHSTALWQRVDFLRDHPKTFADHMMLGFEARGLDDTSIHTLRFNRAQQEVGIVKLKLPGRLETVDFLKR